MGLLRLLVTGAAVVAAVNYATKKRPDGSSLADDLKNQASDLKGKAEPYLNRIKDQITNATGTSRSESNQPTYPQRFDNPSPDPDPTYSS